VAWEKIGDDRLGRNPAFSHDRTRWRQPDKTFAPLIPDYFYQNPFFSPTVKFAVKYLLPGTKIEFPCGYGYDYLSTHNLPF
jgi:hypothetical protein